jgi:5-methylcytosine-specific restriction enzyme A
MPSRPPSYENPRPPRRPEPRGTSRERGYDSTWQRLRDAHLAAHPYCQHCFEKGLSVPGQVVDHIVAFKGNEALRLDPTNLMTLCKVCHGRKSVAHDGTLGFKRTPVTGASPAPAKPTTWFA